MKIDMLPITGLFHFRELILEAVRKRVLKNKERRKQYALSKKRKGFEK